MYIVMNIKNKEIKKNTSVYDIKCVRDELACW